jgi:hypothetical protein
MTQIFVILYFISKFDQSLRYLTLEAYLIASSFSIRNTSIIFGIALTITIILQNVFRYYTREPLGANNYTIKVIFLKMKKLFYLPIVMLIGVLPQFIRNNRVFGNPFETGYNSNEATMVFESVYAIIELVLSNFYYYISNFYKLFGIQIPVIHNISTSLEAALHIFIGTWSFLIIFSTLISNINRKKVVDSEFLIILSLLGLFAMHLLWAWTSIRFIVLYLPFIMIFYLDFINTCQSCRKDFIRKLTNFLNYSYLYIIAIISLVSFPIYLFFYD